MSAAVLPTRCLYYGPVHVTLVHPPPVKPRSVVNHPGSVPPLGVACLAATLRRAGHEVTVIDAYGLAPDALSCVDEEPRLLVNGLDAGEIAARVPHDTGLIGVSCMFSNEWVNTSRVIGALSSRFPETPLVAGGEHVTADAAGVLRRHPGIAACVLGEGEETAVELVEALARRGPLDGVHGLALRGEDGGVVRTPPRRRIRQVDDLPWPSWDGIPIATYLDRGIRHLWERRRAMPMLATRGCPYRCTFCSSPQMWGTTWLARDPRDVVREMAHYVQKYHIDHVDFYDLTMLVNRAWAVAFCHELIAARLGVTWAMPVGTRSEPLDAETLALVRASGCNYVGYAPESGSPATLARIRKRVDLGEMLGSMRAAVRAGLHVRAHLIMGLPGQTRGEVLESLVFAMKMMWVGVQDVAMFRFAPYPGSALFDDLVRAGKIDPEGPGYERLLAAGLLNDDMAPGQSWNEHMSARTTRMVCVLGMLLFYALRFALRPHRAIASAVNAIRRRPRSAFDRLVINAIGELALGRRTRRVRRAPPQMRESCAPAPRRSTM
jgi:radical SAM superfamily enzyme YgiQ (UPF0313 family)